MNHTIVCPRCKRGCFANEIVNSQYIVMTCQGCAEQLMFSIAALPGSLTDELIYNIAQEA